MIEKLQDELYQLENKQARGAQNEAKNAIKVSSKYLKNRT